jgi:CheY-like chemotaxis protein
LTINSPQQDATPGSASKRFLKILVADDNPDAVNSLATLLEIIGHDVRRGYDGLEALESAAAFRPQVAILDIGMPKFNGYDVARKLRNEPWGKSTVLVALTGWGQEKDKADAKAAGFDRHFTKPADIAALNHFLEETAQRLAKDAQAN